MIVTTADNALLKAASVNAMIGALQSHDVAIAMASREAVLAAHPEGQRRFYRFKDGEFSNCNLYGLRDVSALKAAEFFVAAGSSQKRPAVLFRRSG